MRRRIVFLPGRNLRGACKVSFREDPRIDEAKAKDVRVIIDRLNIQGLVRVSGEMIGPCPLCGGRDRFGINLSSRAYNCRQCDVKGGDVIALVQQVLGKGFLEALDWICGELPADLDPAEVERRRRVAARARQQQEDYAAQKRKEAINWAKSWWDQGASPHGTLVEGYFARRGMPDLLARLSSPLCLRFHPELPYMQYRNGNWVELHRGPAMLAAVQNPGGMFRCLHRTWIDLDEPKGRLVLRDPDGNPIVDSKGKRLKTKLTIGSKQGGAIRLRSSEGADTLIMGEGIETTSTALFAQPDGFETAAYWAGVDLGNMAGPMLKQKGVKYSGQPSFDNDRPCFVPPEWVKRLVFIMDGDSDPAMTRAKLECGIRRACAMRPGLVGEIVPADPGCDLNDMLVGADETTEGGA